jgi:hypothetical protein
LSKEDGNTVTYLLRRKTTFDNDPVIQEYIKSGHAKLSIGDALKEEDVRAAWTVAASASDTGKVDAVLFSIGEFPPRNLRSFSLF